MKKIGRLLKCFIIASAVIVMAMSVPSEIKAADLANQYAAAMLQYQMNLQALQNQASIEAAQNQQKFAELQNQMTMQMQAESQNIVANAAPDFSYRLSVCQTKYREGQDRTVNVKQAAANINGVILAPGQFFSANAAFKPRTVANGYGYGDAITGNTHTKVIGGGICQVSSTLNVAVMRAGIIPTKRQNHSSRIAYLKSGLDATISGNTYDYQFVNTLAYPIMILTDTTNGVLSISIYSSPLATGGFTYEPVVVGNNKDNTTYLCAYLNGVEVARTYAFQSHYRK